MRVAEERFLGLYVVLTADLAHGELGAPRPCPIRAVVAETKAATSPYRCPIEQSAVVVTFDADGGFGAQVQGVHVSGHGGDLWGSGVWTKRRIQRRSIRPPSR